MVSDANIREKEYIKVVTIIQKLYMIFDVKLSSIFQEWIIRNSWILPSFFSPNIFLEVTKLHIFWRKKYDTLENALSSTFFGLRE